MGHGMACRYIDALVARRGTASKWSGTASLLQGSSRALDDTIVYKAGCTTIRQQHALQSSVCCRGGLATDILAVMASKDGLDDLDDGVRDSDEEENDSERDHYFSD